MRRQSSHRIRAVFMTVGLAFMLALHAEAQDETPTKVTNQNRAGDLPFSSSVGTGIEHVNLATGNLAVRIPIASVKGRGMDFDFGVRYDALFWIAATRTLSGQPTFQVWNVEKRNYIPTSSTGVGWEPTVAGVTHTSVMVDCIGGGLATLHSNYIYEDVAGGKHPLAAQIASDCLNNGVIEDGPDITQEGMWGTTSSKVYLADGTLNTGIPFGVSNLFTDSNGNKKTQTAGGLDTLGRTLVTSSGTNPLLYQVRDSDGSQSGNLQTYTLNFTDRWVSTSFGATGPYGAINEAGATRSMLTSVVMPNERSYSFQYDGDPYGGITRIDLPTGAFITYTWATFLDGDRTHRYVRTRTVNVGGQTAIWDIYRECVTPGMQGCAVIKTTVTDPLQNKTVYESKYGAVTSAKFYKDVIAGTPVREYTVEYLGSSNPDHLEVSGPPFRMTTKLENGLVSKKEVDYEQFTYQYTPCSDVQFCSPPEQITTTRGNVTEVREYDWGQGQAGPLLRRTVREYLHNAQPTYKTFNIVNKVLNETIFDGLTGQQKARTEFEYDSTPIVSTTGAPQHDYTNYPSSFTVRGNATKVKKWRNTDGALLTTTYTYDDLGNIRSIQDPGLHTTTFSYDDRWSSGTFCLPPSNSLAYVTEKANALSPPHRVQLTYYPCTGLLQARKDENDIQAGRAGTTFTYDLLNRLRITDFSDGGRTENVYSDIPPASITTSIKIDASISNVTTSIFDGLGRVVTKLLSDPACAGSGGNSHLDTTYDLLSRTNTVTNPYCTTSDPTYGLTTYVYDEIGRTKKVIPPDGSEFSNNFSTSYDGNITTVTDQAGRQRKTFTDALGRITRVDEPGSGGQP